MTAATPRHVISLGMTTESPSSVPQEVLEHIAFFAATRSLIGPPTGLPPLLLTCRHIYQTLSFEANPYLYARIFAYKFDTRSVFRRLGAHVITPRVLANELRKRWIHLKWIRARTGCRIRHPESYQPSHSLIDLLWLAYLMMIENDGKNEQQLLDYAEMDAWLMEYWFDDQGASSAAHMIVVQHTWPIQDEKNSIAMWLFWLLLRPGPIMRNIVRYPHMTTIIKLTALAANHYPVCYPSWTEFLPRSEAVLPPSVITHFTDTYRLNPPTLAPAAILIFLTLALRLLSPRANRDGVQSLQFPASSPLSTRRSEDWDADWYRCINIGQSECCRAVSETYVLGSVEGVWEGVFTYTEFTAYSMLLSGGAPPVLDNCLVAHHRQTWKLREYYLSEHQERAQETCRPVGPGDPLKAYFPAGTRLQEHSDSVEVHEPGRDAVHYRRASHVKSDGHRVMDVILLGEGHSAWGQFNLYGRVRPLDGFMSFSKEYIDGDRARWLYRGYLVGNVNGHISGRWRDTLSPSDLPGYEGCFVMSRRG